MHVQPSEANILCLGHSRMWNFLSLEFISQESEWVGGHFTSLECSALSVALEVTVVIKWLTTEQRAKVIQFIGKQLHPSSTEEPTVEEQLAFVSLIELVHDFVECTYRELPLWHLSCLYLYCRSVCYSRHHIVTLSPLLDQSNFS